MTHHTALEVDPPRRETSATQPHGEPERFRSSMLSATFALTFASIVTAVPAHAKTLAGVELCESLETPAGVLHLTVCGVRDSLWIDHYVTALYVAPGAPLHVLNDPNQPKAVLLHIVESRYLPPRLPKKWARALARELEPRAMSKVTRAYRQLADGDVVSITYSPAAGVVMSVNASTVVRAPRHRVIGSILREWAGKESLKKKLVRVEREHSC